jgi:hypothetical protein
MGTKRRAPAGIYDETRLAGLQGHALARRAETVRRLQEAIDQLTEAGEVVTVAAIERASGLRYTTIKRNDEARRLWERHSPYHQAKRKTPKARDPLPTMSRSELLAAVRAARDAQKELERMVRMAYEERDDLRTRYNNLLQDHLPIQRRIAELEAETAECRAQMAYIRSSPPDRAPRRDW